MDITIETICDDMNSDESDSRDMIDRQTRLLVTPIITS